MVELSVSTDGGFTTFEPRMATFSKMAELICTNRYSPIVFKEGKRSEKNFDHADIIALDFDGGLSIAEAEQRFKDYRYIIAPTKSHQKDKNGQVCDRFRVVLFLSERITDLAVYKSTAVKLLQMFPEADRACKDGARYFEPSTRIAKINNYGLQVEPCSVEVKELEPANSVSTDSNKGDLSRLTYQFITFGAPAGEWNSRLLKATIDLQEQGYTIEEAKSLLSRATGHLDNNDLKTIQAQFAREVRYEKRELPKFDFKPLGDLMKQRPKINWLVEGLLSVGGFSLIAGQPKSGKSTLTRQLAMSVAKGERFLDRKCKSGRVLYLALEEQEEMLYEQFKRLGVKKDEDRILIHVGRITTQNPSDLLLEAAQVYEPSLIVIDTMLLFDRFGLNDYNEVNEALEKLRTVARKSTAHVCAIHHQNKSPGNGATTIMGSNAIHGAVDNAMILSIPYGGIEGERVLNSSQRGGKPFRGQSILFNPETETYTLGGMTRDEF